MPRHMHFVNSLPTHCHFKMAAKNTYQGLRTLIYIFGISFNNILIRCLDWVVVKHLLVATVTPVLNPDL